MNGKDKSFRPKNTQKNDMKISSYFGQMTETSEQLTCIWEQQRTLTH